MRIAWVLLQKIPFSRLNVQSESEDKHDQRELSSQDVQHSRAPDSLASRPIATQRREARTKDVPNEPVRRIDGRGRRDTRSLGFTDQRRSGADAEANEREQSEDERHGNRPVRKSMAD